VIIGKAQGDQGFLAAWAIDSSPLVRGDGRHGLEFMAALFAEVFVDRHGSISFQPVLVRNVEQTFDINSTTRWEKMQMFYVGYY
jgi:hypothetical protein